MLDVKSLLNRATFLLAFLPIPDSMISYIFKQSFIDSTAQAEGGWKPYLALTLHRGKGL